MVSRSLVIEKYRAYKDAQKIERPGLTLTFIGYVTLDLPFLIAKR
jgi:hypothetical protein